MRRVCVVRKRILVSGFREMEGVAFYLPTQRKLKTLICFFLSPDNKGPIPMDTRTVPWPVPSDVRGMRLALENRMTELLNQILERTYPEKGLFLEQCNPQNDPTFLEKVCSKCVCPYCEIAVPL